MARKKESKGRYNFLIDSKVYDEFSKICEVNGLVRGKQVELAMKEIVKRFKGGRK